MRVRYWQMTGHDEDPQPWPTTTFGASRGLILNLPEGAEFEPVAVHEAFCRAFDDEGSNYTILWTKTMQDGEWLIIASKYDGTKVVEAGPWEFLLIAIKED